MEVLTVKRLIAILTLVSVALPASAATTGDFEWDGDQVKLVRHQQEYEVVEGGHRYQILGHFFHVVAPDGTETSVEIPRNAVGYALHADGTVTFTLADEPAPEVEPTPQIADVSADEWATFVAENPEQVRRYRTSAGAYPF